MTTFEDGPAKGQCLMLKRSPRFLRVTQHLHPKETWDALDRLEDEPLVQEKLLAYERVGKPGVCHIHKRGGGGFYTMASYRFVPTQPSDEQMRTVSAWREWCLAQPKVIPAAAQQSATPPPSSPPTL